LGPQTNFNPTTNLRPPTSPNSISNHVPPATSGINTSPGGSGCPRCTFNSNSNVELDEDPSVASDSANVPRPYFPRPAMTNIISPVISGGSTSNAGPPPANANISSPPSRVDPGNDGESPALPSNPSYGLPASAPAPSLNAGNSDASLPLQNPTPRPSTPPTSFPPQTNPLGNNLPRVTSYRAPSTLNSNSPASSPKYGPPPQQLPIAQPAPRCAPNHYRSTVCP
jgi:hypothetical protein